MPLVYQQNINEHTKLGVWHITEQEDFFLKSITLQNSITHPHKRLQHLAGRYLLRDLYPGFPVELIMIADTMKPFLENEAYHFSISHCGDFAAAIVSTSNRVGTDIEIPQRKITNIRFKFLKEQELLLMDSLPLIHEQALTVGWSIKEAIFKWYGAGKVDFRGHIDINDISLSGNNFTASCTFSRNEIVKLTVQGRFLNDNVLTWLYT